MSPALLRYGSLFSGIGAASVGWSDLGWSPAWFAEIDPFASSVLAHHWPDVPNLGDVQAADFAVRAGRVDVVVGGSPCQSWSQAGQRAGLDDPRGRLTTRYFEIVEAIRPKWWVWENVPGVLTHDEGRTFTDLRHRMSRAGYTVSHRPIDARRFGLPHRRVRLFVVGHLGGAAGEALFAPQVRSTATTDVPRSTRRRSGVATAACGVAVRTRPEGLAAELSPAAHCLTTGRGVAGNYVWDGRQIREYTPVERERLLGFPDGHTDIDGATTGDRVRATGNTMAVPVIRWIGERIKEVEATQAGMSELQRLELKIRRELPGLNLRPTLDSAARVGGLLAEAKTHVQHGEWMGWIKRFGLKQRTANDYLAVHHHAAEWRTAANLLPSHLTIKQLLDGFRRAKYVATRAERDATRAEHAAERGRLPQDIRLAHADCQTWDGWGNEP